MFTNFMLFFRNFAACQQQICRLNIFLLHFRRKERTDRKLEQRMMNMENLLMAMLKNQKESHANLLDPRVSNYTIQLTVSMGEIWINPSNEWHQLQMVSKQYFSKSRYEGSLLFMCILPFCNTFNSPSGGILAVKKCVNMKQTC